MVHRPIHPLSEHDGGRLLNSDVRLGLRRRPDDPTDLIKKLETLILSDDPMDRVDAAAIVQTLRGYVWCPDGVWVVQSRYKADETGERWSDEIVTWSAHLTREQALDWHEFWTKKWQDRRTDYEMLPVSQANRVPLHYLRHPDAKVGEGVSL